MNFKLFGKTILVLNLKFGLFRGIHSASEVSKRLAAWVMFNHQDQLGGLISGF